MPTVTIGTAEIALILSAALVIWHVVRYLLEGGRVRVRMRPALLTDWGELRSGPDGGWPQDSPQLEARGRYNVELAHVTIENLGRIAVTVTEAGLDFGRVGRRPWHRRSVWLQPVAFDDSFTTELSVRIEPFDQCMVLFDLWPVVEHARSGRQDKMIVRASARVAGRRIRHRSPWNRRWDIQQDQASLIPGHSPTFFEVIYRVAWRHLRTEEGGGRAFASLVARLVEPLFDDGARPTEEELRTAIEKALEHREPFMPPHMIAYDILEATKGRVPEGPSMEALSKQRGEEAGR